MRKLEWKLVPVEPTKEMMSNADAHHEGYRDGLEVGRIQGAIKERKRYVALIAAAEMVMSLSDETDLAVQDLGKALDAYMSALCQTEGDNADA